MRHRRHSSHVLPGSTDDQVARHRRRSFPEKKRRGSRRSKDTFSGSESEEDDDRHRPDYTENTTNGLTSDRVEVSGTGAIADDEMDESESNSLPVEQQRAVSFLEALTDPANRTVVLLFLQMSFSMLVLPLSTFFAAQWAIVDVMGWGSKGGTMAAAGMAFAVVQVVAFIYIRRAYLEECHDFNDRRQSKQAVDITHLRGNKDNAKETEPKKMK